MQKATDEDEEEESLPASIGDFTRYRMHFQQRNRWDRELGCGA